MDGGKECRKGGKGIGKGRRKDRVNSPLADESGGLYL